MTRHDLAIIAKTALLTMAVVVLLALCLPGVQADVAAAGQARPPPALYHQGARFTLATGHDAVKVGDRPTVLLSAASGSLSDLTTKVNVVMMLTTPSPPEARMVAMPRQVWSQPCTITLHSGETKRLELAPGVALGAGDQATFVISAGGRAVQALSFGVPAAPRQQVGATQRAAPVLAASPQVVTQ